MFEYRVWPDYTVQESCCKPYPWMSDDYVYIDADDEQEAITKYKEIYG